MNRVTLALCCIPLLVAGCSSYYEPKYCVVIPDERRAEAAEWVVRCVEAANPKSDEEPEDNIRAAMAAARELFGETQVVAVHRIPPFGDVLGTYPGVSGPPAFKEIPHARD